MLKDAKSETIATEIKSTKKHNLLLFIYFRDRPRNIGSISCRVCSEDFQTSITCIFF